MVKSQFQIMTVNPNDHQSKIDRRVRERDREGRYLGREVGLTYEVKRGPTSNIKEETHIDTYKTEKESWSTQERKEVLR